MATEPRASNTGKQSDMLLWVAGGVVAAVGTAWLFILAPWTGDAEAPAAAPVVLATAAPPVGTTPPADALPADDGTALDNPLRMADLAYQAGMLVEPEDYSAWTLYSKALKNDMTHQAALEGITRVADDLVRRGETALEQGRFDDARATVERIRAVLPEHDGAAALAEKIWPATSAMVSPPDLEVLKPELPQLPRKAAAEPVAAEAPQRPVVDPVVEASAAFDKAMAGSRLLTPATESAKHFLETMAAAGPDHEITLRARARLATELLSRAAQSLEAQDVEAAAIWIDEAAGIGADTNAVVAARARVVDRRIALEAAKRVPASELMVRNYVAPEYPERALERRIEGWVDIDFTVATDGTTANVTVTDASHETYFRKEAVAAVEQWRFEPRVFLDRPIEQRAYTRIRFVQ